MQRHGFIKIGNINQLSLRGKAGGGKGMGIGQRIKSVTTKALDKGQAFAEEQIDLAFGDDGGEERELDGELTEAQAEEALEGLAQAARAVRGLRTPEGRKLRQAISGLHEAITGALDQSDGGGEAGGLVDVIGLDGTGGMTSGSFGSDEWR